MKQYVFKIIWQILCLWWYTLAEVHGDDGFILLAERRLCEFSNAEFTRSQRLIYNLFLPYPKNVSEFCKTSMPTYFKLSSNHLSCDKISFYNPFSSDAGSKKSNRHSNIRHIDFLSAQNASWYRNFFKFYMQTKVYFLYIDSFGNLALCIIHTPSD